MKFDLSRIDQTLADSSVEFLNQLGYTTETGGTCIEWKCDPKADRLSVEYKAGTLLLDGRERVHFYRGLTLFLSELIECGDNCREFKKEERISFRETGVMLDCSRNGAANIQFLKRMIRFCASCGLNQLYLYMEDMYEVSDHPYFGAWRGRFKHDELEEIDRYGQKFGLEVIPAIQTLAHMHTYLRWPAAQKLKDTDDILMVGSPETDAFVESMIRNASGSFSTKKIHVGMDEADFLGLGRYLRIHGYEDRYQIMTKHLKTVCSICKELGLQPMIWSDMFFRLKSPTGDYYDLPEETTFDEIFALPDELELVYWDYYHHDQRNYEKNIRLHHKITERLRFAAGGWTWNGISPNYSKAEKTIAEGITACRKHEVDKVFCTFWFDNGAETPMQTVWYPTAYFAQQCYGGLGKETDKMLQVLTGTGVAEYRLLDRFDNVNGTSPENENADNPSKYVLYQDILLGLFDAQIADASLSYHYRKLAEELQRQIGTVKNADTERVFSYYRILAEVLSVKAELGIEIYKTYTNNDKKKMLLLCKKVSECAEKVETLREMREQIWFYECRPFGFEVLDIRFGAVSIRLHSARKRMESWIAGHIDRIEELEEPRLLYTEDKNNPKHSQCAASFWENIVSAANVSGI